MNQTDLCFAAVTDLTRLIRHRKISPVELLDAILAKVERCQPSINAFATVSHEEALEAARQAESDVIQNKDLGPLHGIPFSVKDLLITENVRTTFGSYIFEHHIPQHDAPCVRRLKDAGAILIGKTTTPEFGHKALTDSPLFGITRNPWNIERSPGGSSGGASAAVAAGLGPLAVGTDGGGSIRIPASCTGIVGLKPTLGRIPHPQAPDLFGNLSYIGPMTRTVADAAVMFQVMAGPDTDDPLSYGWAGLDSKLLPNADNLKAVKGCKIAWSPTLGNTEVDHQTLELTQQAVEVFTDLGAIVEEARPEFEPTEELFIVLFHTSLATRLRSYVAAFGDKLDPTLLDAIQQGHQYKAMDLQETIYKRSRLFQTIQQFFRRYDLLMTPTVSTPALPADHNAMDPIEINGKVAGSMRGSWYPDTHPFNMAGNPALSIPCGWTNENLPVGLQIVGPWLAESKILQAAAAFEAARPWSDRRPI